MATYLRYHIVTDDDIQAALEQTDDAISVAVAATAKPTRGTLSGEQSE